MKPLWGLAVSAGLVVCATAASAQAPYRVAGSPYIAASDVSGPAVGPYGALPPEPAGPGYGYGPPLMPPGEIYTVLRENGFSPLGAPQQRGFFYRIAVVDRRGDDGRVVIDARDGRIVRFTPAYEMGSRYDDYGYGYGAPPGPPLPPMANLRGTPPRPPASVPHVASRTPVPKPSPLAAKPAIEPAQQSASITAKPAEAPPPAAAPAPIEAKPAAPQIAPTQPMPKVQGLE
jgi:hypothetical protein